MTKAEQSLCAAMAQVVESVDPVTAQALRSQAETPKEALLTPQGPIVFYSRRSNTVILTNNQGENVYLSSEAFAALSEFVSRIGWSCD